MVVLPVIPKNPSLRGRLLKLCLRLFVKKNYTAENAVEKMRAAINFSDRFIAKKDEKMFYEKRSICGTEVNWIKNKNESHNENIILYLHGGGFCVNMPHLYEAFLAKLCKNFPAQGLIPDYRLAPEHPFPAALDDCLAIYFWLMQKGFDSNKLVIAGDSAGGCLALAMMLKLRDQNIPLPSCAILLSPVTDFSHIGWSFVENRKKDPFFNIETLLIFKNHYLKNTSPDNPLVSPIKAELHGLPPLLIQVGDAELLLDDSLRVANRSQYFNVDTTLDVWPGMPHIFPVFHQIPESNLAIARMSSFIQRHVGLSLGKG